MKTMAQIMAEDRKIMRHVHHNYTVVSEETKFKRKNEEAARGLRIEGVLDSMKDNYIYGKYQRAIRSSR